MFDLYFSTPNNIKNISDQVVDTALNLPQGHLSLHDIEYLLLSSTRGYYILSSVNLAPTHQLVSCFQSPLATVVLLTLAVHHKLILSLERFILESRIMYILSSCCLYIRGSFVSHPSEDFVMLGTISIAWQSWS